jgi:hypothetical protein
VMISGRHVLVSSLKVSISLYSQREPLQVSGTKQNSYVQFPNSLDSRFNLGHRY